MSYDDAARTAAATTPLTVGTRDQYVRATAQALPALRWAPLGPSTVADVKQAAGRFTHAGSAVTISATSREPGRRRLHLPPGRSAGGEPARGRERRRGHDA